jgi:hypothetical protein
MGVPILVDRGPFTHRVSIVGPFVRNITFGG